MFPEYLAIYYFDKRGRATGEEDALGDKTSRRHDGQSHVIQTTGPRNFSTSFTYDGSNNLISTTNARNEQSKKVYDAQFHLTDTYDPLNNHIHYDYYADHHLWKTTTSPESGLTLTTENSYYANGLLQTVTDARQTPTTTIYDQYGNPDSRQTGAHPQIDYTYDALGRMTQLVDQEGAVTKLFYDNRGLITKKTDPLNRDTLYSYYDDGSLHTKTDRLGNVISYAYTPSGKIDAISYQDGSTVKFVYNKLNHLESMSDQSGTSRYTYDAVGRFTSATDPHGLTVQYEYDAAGNMTKIIYPDNKQMTYSYDELNRLHYVDNWLGQRASYTYDAAGRLTSLTNFNGTITSYGYDNANRRISLDNMAGTNPIATYQFTLDANGNPTRIQQDEPLAPRLSTATTNFVYNTRKNRLNSAGATTFTYDNEGQLASKDATNFTFDYEHRLTGIGTNIHFTYDGRGNRLTAVRNGVETRYIYDQNGNLLAEADNTNTILRYYIHGSGLLAMMTPANETYCYQFNSTGSTIAMTDMNKNMVNKYAYTAFGKIANQQEAVNQPFKYVGQYGIMAETNGFYYMRARYYDPEVRRFISEDPSGFDGGDLNLYAYVQNNPVNHVDPSGLLTGVGDLFAWGGIKTAEYAVKGISSLAGKPMTDAQFQKMDESLIGGWGKTTTATPYAVGAGVALVTGNSDAGIAAATISGAIINGIAGQPIGDPYLGIEWINPPSLNQNEPCSSK